MATTKQIDVNGTSVTVVSFDHSAQEIDDMVDRVQRSGIAIEDRTTGEKYILYVDNGELKVIKEDG